MSCDKRPWYKWFPKDFISDEKVKCLPPLAELVYRRALDLMWQSNNIRIPNAMPLLYQSLGNGMSIAEFNDAWDRIQYPDFELFCVSEDKKWFISNRLKAQADELSDISNKRQIAGIKAASSRWEKQKYQTHTKRIPNVQQTQVDTDTDTDTDIKEKPPISPKEKKFEPPTIEDVKLFFAEKGYRQEVAEKAWSYYHVAKWKDARGNPVKNWKQKMISNWMNDDAKDTKKPIVFKTAEEIEREMQDRIEAQNRKVFEAIS